MAQKMVYSLLHNDISLAREQNFSLSSSSLSGEIMPAVERHFNHVTEVSL